MAGAKTRHCRTGKSNRAAGAASTPNICTRAFIPRVAALVRRVKRHDETANRRDRTVSRRISSLAGCDGKLHVCDLRFWCRGDERAHVRAFHPTAVAITRFNEHEFAVRFAQRDRLTRSQCVQRLADRDRRNVNGRVLHGDDSPMQLRPTDAHR